jgi:hypothetical protein
LHFFPLYQEISGAQWALLHIFCNEINHLETKPEAVTPKNAAKASTYNRLCK